jgi:hypothetical protein
MYTPIPAHCPTPTSASLRAAQAASGGIALLDQEGVQLLQLGPAFVHRVFQAVWYGRGLLPCFQRGAERREDAREQRDLGDEQHHPLMDRSDGLAVSGTELGDLAGDQAEGDSAPRDGKRIRDP